VECADKLRKVGYCGFIISEASKAQAGGALQEEDRGRIVLGLASVIQGRVTSKSPLPLAEPVFSYKLKSRAYFALKSEFKRACRRFWGLCAPPAPHSALKRDIVPVCATWGSVHRA
jgi:hypothetical protein